MHVFGLSNHSVTLYFWHWALGVLKVRRRLWDQNAMGYCQGPENFENMLWPGAFKRPKSIIREHHFLVSWDVQCGNKLFFCNCDHCVCMEWKYGRAAVLDLIGSLDCTGEIYLRNGGSNELCNGHPMVHVWQDNFCITEHRNFMRVPFFFRPSDSAKDPRAFRIRGNAKQNKTTTRRKINDKTGYTRSWRRTTTLHGRKEDWPCRLLKFEFRKFAKNVAQSHLWTSLSPETFVAEIFAETFNRIQGFNANHGSKSGQTRVDEGERFFENFVTPFADPISNHSCIQVVKPKIGQIWHRTLLFGPVMEHFHVILWTSVWEAFFLCNNKNNSI